MKPIQEVYPGFEDDMWPCVSDYNPLLESFGYEILLKVDDEDYAGDSRVLFRDGEKYGLLIFGWGSCCACDALQACRTYEELEQLRQTLHNDIKWGTAEELLHYIETKDWELEWCYYAENTKKFIRQAKRLLRKAIKEAGNA